MPKKKSEPNPTPNKIDWNGSLADFKNVTTGAKPTATVGNVKPGGTKMSTPNSKPSNLEKIGNVVGEVSGLNDLQRVVDKPTKANIAWAGLSAASYVVPGLYAAKSGRAVTRAGELAAIEVMSNRASAEASAAAGTNVIKSLTLKNGQGALEAGGSQVARLFGERVTTEGPKNLARVYGATQRMMNEAARGAEQVAAAQIAGRVQGMRLMGAAVQVSNAFTGKAKNQANIKKK